MFGYSVLMQIKILRRLPRKIVNNGDSMLWFADERLVPTRTMMKNQFLQCSTEMLDIFGFLNIVYLPVAAGRLRMRRAVLAGIWEAEAGVNLEVPRRGF